MALYDPCYIFVSHTCISMTAERSLTLIVKFWLYYVIMPQF